MLEAHQARLHGRDFSLMVRSQLWSRVILVARMRSRIWAMLAAVKLREHYSLYVASVEGVPQDPLVRLSESTPSRHSCATDGRSRRLKVSADRDGSGIHYQEQRALRRFIAT